MTEFRRRWPSLAGVRESKFFFGWAIVAVCVLTSAMRAGLGTQTIGFLIKPMELNLGATAVAVTACIMSPYAVGAIAGPLVGKLLDRIGGRAVVAVGAACDGIMFMLMSQVTSLWELALIMGVLGGFAEACVGYTVLMPFVSKWFVRRRGLAVGVVATGANLGGIVFAPLIVVLTTGLGWRTAWFAAGLIPLLVVAPLAWLILRATPEEIGSAPDGGSARDIANAAGESSFTLRQALSTPAFWLLLAAWNLTDFAAKGALVNKIPYAMQMGFSAATIAGLITAFGVASIIGKLLVGWIAQRVNATALGAVLGLIQALGIYFFIGAHGIVRLYVSYGVLAGISSGGLITLMPLLLANYFGRKHQGAISGVAAPFMLISTLGGPMIAPWFFDVTGSYAGGFLCFAASATLGGILLLLMRRPPPVPEEAGVVP